MPTEKTDVITKRRYILSNLYDSLSILIDFISESLPSCDIPDNMPDSEKIVKIAQVNAVLPIYNALCKIVKARQALAQPSSERPTDEEIETLGLWLDTLSAEKQEQLFQRLSENHMKVLVVIHEEDGTTMPPDVDTVKALIQLGAKSRPMLRTVSAYNFKINSPFYCRWNRIKDYRQVINKFYSKGGLSLAHFLRMTSYEQGDCGYVVQRICEIIHLFFTHPTPALEEQLLQTDAHYSSKYNLVLFLAHLFKTDDTSLFKSSVLFRKFLMSKPSCLKGALDCAVAFGAIKWLRILIRLDLLDGEDYRTVAKIAAASGNVEILGLVYDYVKPVKKTILSVVREYVSSYAYSKKKQGIFYKDTSFTPTCCAIRCAQDDTLRYMILRGALLIPEKNIQYLLLAVRSNNCSAVKLLLDNGIPVNQADELGDTALQVATSRGYMDICKLLKEKGAVTEPSARPSVNQAPQLTF